MVNILKRLIKSVQRLLDAGEGEMVCDFFASMSDRRAQACHQEWCVGSRST
jgi:dGTP triphosphohydrolase